MDPPFATSSLTPALSPISAQFESQLQTSSKSTRKSLAASSLGECAQLKGRGAKDRLSLPVDERAQPYSYHSPASHLNAPGLHPVHYSRYASGFGTANSKAFEWSRLISVGLEGSMKRSSSSTSRRSTSPTTASRTSPAQPSLLSAISVESLPHYTLPLAADDPDEDPETAHHSRTQVSNATTALTHMRLESINLPESAIQLNLQSRPALAHLQSDPGPANETDERLDSPSPLQSIELSNGRRKLSLSMPKDRLNSSPLLHRRPHTPYNAAGIFHGPVSRELSGFANPAVEAAEERWRRTDDGDVSALRLEPCIIGDLFSQHEASTEAHTHPNHLRTSAEQVFGTASDDMAFSYTNSGSGRRLPLSLPHETQNSSPILHSRPKRFQQAGGVHVDWIARERSGFANPTQAASRERWTTVDERESRGRWIGLPSSNSWDLSKTHVLNSSNCFDSIGNGFGMSRRIFGQGVEGTLSDSMQSTVVSADLSLPILAGFGGKDAELSRKTYVLPPNTRPGLFTSHSDTSEVTAAEVLPAPLDDEITPYPVPASLVAASKRAIREAALAKVKKKDASPARPLSSSRRDSNGGLNRGKSLGDDAGLPKSGGFGESNNAPAREMQASRDAKLGWA